MTGSMDRPWQTHRSSGSCIRRRAKIKRRKLSSTWLGNPSPKRSKSNLRRPLLCEPERYVVSIFSSFTSADKNFYDTQADAYQRLKKRGWRIELKGYDAMLKNGEGEHIAVSEHSEPIHTDSRPVLAAFFSQSTPEENEKYLVLHGRRERDRAQARASVSVVGFTISFAK